MRALVFDDAVNCTHQWSIAVKACSSMVRTAEVLISAAQKGEAYVGIYSKIIMRVLCAYFQELAAVIPMPGDA